MGSKEKNGKINIPEGEIEKIVKELKKSTSTFKKASLKDKDNKTTLTAVKKSKDVVSNISKEHDEVKSRVVEEANRMNEIDKEYKTMDKQQGKKNQKGTE